MRISRRNEANEHRREVSDDTKMGIVLLFVALVAFGAYTLFLFAGFIADIVSH